jgi:hypothetical protein
MSAQFLPAPTSKIGTGRQDRTPTKKLLDCLLACEEQATLPHSVILAIRSLLEASEPAVGRASNSHGHVEHCCTCLNQHRNDNHFGHCTSPNNAENQAGTFEAGNHENGILTASGNVSVTQQHGVDGHIAGITDAKNWSGILEHGKETSISTGINGFNPQQAKINDIWYDVFDLDAAALDEKLSEHRCASLSMMYTNVFDLQCASLKDDVTSGQTAAVSRRNIDTLDFAGTSFEHPNHQGHAASVNGPTSASGTTAANFRGHHTNEQSFHAGQQQQTAWGFHAANIQANPLGLALSTQKSNDNFDFNHGINLDAMNISRHPIILVPPERRQQANPGPARGNFPCQHCMKSFTRTADRDRHARGHDPNAIRYSCPALGCDRAGDNGFLRKDKLKKHRAEQGH